MASLLLASDDGGDAFLPTPMCVLRTWRVRVRSGGKMECRQRGECAVW